MTTPSLVPVLHVEDSPTDALLIREEMGQYRHFQLTQVDRLEAALRVLGTGHYAVALLDLGLPDSQGLETLVRFHSEAPHVPVVVMTASDDEELALRAIQEGAEDYLVKGQTREYLLDRTLRHAIERNLTRAALRERAALASLTADVGMAFTSNAGLPEMLERCVASMVEHLGAAFARIWTLNPATNILELQASAGLYTNIDGAHSRVPVGQYKVGRIAAERKPYFTNDLAHDARISDPEWVKREGMVEFAGYPLLLDDRLVGVVGMFARQRFTDATLQGMPSVANQIALGIERKQGEETLRVAEARKAAILEASLDAIISMDHSGLILAFNPAAERIFGFTEAEAVGQPLADLIIPKPLRPLHYAGLARQAAGGASKVLNQRLELPALRKDGSEFPAELTITRIRSDGPPIYTAFLRDITERNRAQESLKLFRALIDHSNDAFEVIDPATGRFLDVNHNCCESMGYSREEILRLGVADVDPPVAERGWAATAEAIRRTGSVSLETLHRRKDGSIFPVEVNAKLVQIDREYVVAVARDITQRRKSETALRESEERFRELTSHIDQVLWMIDAKESKILYVSPGYEKMWGRSRHTVMENHPSDMEGIHPLDLEMLRRANTAMYETGHIDAECRVLRPDGSVRWVWIRGYPVREHGQIVRLVGVIEDITEKRRLAAERDALLARLQLHIERMPLAYVLKDADFRIIDWNAAAERIFGYSKEEMLGTGPPYEKFVPRSFREKAVEIFGRLRAGDMEAHSVNENLTKDGRTITCQWLNTPLMDDAGQFAGLLCLAQDVTERKSLEEQLRQAQKLEAIGSLAGGVAHDFNNLLTIINGYSEMIPSQLPPDSPVRELVREIGQAGERAASLTRQLLAFSRKQVLEPKVLNLNAVVIDIAKMIKRLIGEDVDLDTGLEPGLGRVKADPGQIEQILINLAVNARDAMPQGGKLTIETANVELDESYTQARTDVRPGRYVLLAVADTGTGMDEATKARIFEPFFTTKELGKGTGLGLATVYGVVKQSGGHIAVYSEPGHGTAFKIYLPLVQEVIPLRPSEPGFKRPLHGTETILLTEDEPALRALCRHVLQMQGYTVVEASQGQKALRIAEEFEGTIHLLVTDVVMPVMGGRQLAERLVAVRPGLKVLYLSGYTDDAVVRHGVLEAETAFLQKPFTPAALAQKVRDVLDRQY